MVTLETLLDRVNAGRATPITLARSGDDIMIFDGSGRLTPTLTEATTRAFLLGMIVCDADYGGQPYTYDRSAWVSTA